MKTTLHIADSLFQQARSLARRRRTTFRAIVEDALRRYLEAQSAAPTRHRLRHHTFKGNGLQPGADPGSWRDMAHEGRGS